MSRDKRRETTDISEGISRLGGCVLRKKSRGEISRDTVPLSHKESPCHLRSAASLNSNLEEEVRRKD
jgi:hypothetical protein